MATGISRGELLWWYGRGNLAAGTLVSAFIAAELYQYGTGPLRLLVYFKLATVLVFGYYTYRRQLRHRAFYHNLGYGTARLVWPVVVVDGLGCVLISILAYAAR